MVGGGELIALLFSIDFRRRAIASLLADQAIQVGVGIFIGIEPGRLASRDPWQHTAHLAHGVPAVVRGDE